MIRLLRHKTTWTKVISILSVVIFAGLLVTVAAILLSDRQRVMDNNTRLVEIYGELYKQTEDQGIEPTTPDPGQVKEDSQESIVGPRGATGSTGGVGPVGPRGPQGEMGMRGQTGPAGEPGEVGAPGAAGKDGAVGSRGLPGVNGEAGASGPVGPAGAAGAQGIPGPQGIPGATGPAGQNGAPGASVLRISCMGTTLVFYGEGDSQLGAVPNSQACATVLVPELPATR